MATLFIKGFIQTPFQHYRIFPCNLIKATLKVYQYGNYVYTFCIEYFTHGTLTARVYLNVFSKQKVQRKLFGE